MEKIIYETIEKEMEELKSRMKKCYYSKSGLKEAEKYMKGLLSRAERKNGWQMSEILGDIKCSSSSIEEDGVLMN